MISIKRGLVSVVIPVFNRAEQLKEAVMSALLQEYSNIEIIIVDDGSTDNTYEVISELSQLWPGTVRGYKQANCGPGTARQMGTNQCMGEFIQYLDSDDLILEGKFKNQVDSLDKNLNAEICYGISYQEDNAFLPPLLIGPMRETGNDIKQLFPKLLNERWWTTSCPLYRRSLLERIGPWKQLINEEDWELDGRAGKVKAELTWVPYNVSIRRINTGEHLSSDGYRDPRKLTDRVTAKNSLYYSAIGAGVRKSEQEMYLFSRECFMLARQSAELGLADVARSAYNLARISSTRAKRYGVDYMLYGVMGQLLGWRRVGDLTVRIKNMLKSLGIKFNYG